MKAARIVFIATMTLVLVGLGTVALVSGWVQAHTFYPTPQNESAFLKAYSPQPVVDKFKCTDCFAQALGGTSAAPGRAFVRRTLNYDGTFALRQEQQLDLMTALRTDLLQRLSENGARVLGQTANAHEGFRIQYVCDKNVGMISILPVDILQPEGTGKLQPQLEQVTLHIVIDERWYPRGLSPWKPTCSRAPDLHVRPAL
jgi:hypothetical protein